MGGGRSHGACRNLSFSVSETISMLCFGTDREIWNCNWRRHLSLAHAASPDSVALIIFQFVYTPGPPYTQHLRPFTWHGGKRKIYVQRREWKNAMQFGTFPCSHTCLISVVFTTIHTQTAECEQKFSACACTKFGVSSFSLSLSHANSA